MACIRCGNKEWDELFPFCLLCAICGKCSGSGYYISNGARCVICSGRGFTVKKNEREVKLARSI